MDLHKELAALGFVNTDPFRPDLGDYSLQDNCDGDGPFISAWLSDKPCPFPDRIKDAPSPTGK
jgi:hypothetical protein